MGSRWGGLVLETLLRAKLQSPGASVALASSS